MSRLRIVQICADRGIAPGGTKGASQHLRGIAAGFAGRGHEVRTFARRAADGAFPVAVHPIDALPMVATADVVYERYSLGHRGGLDLARSLGVPFVLEVNAPLVDEATSHRPDTVGPSDRTTERELLRDADLVVSVSSELTAWIARHRTAPVLTQPNGFEPSWFDTAPPPATAGDAPFPLAFIGHPKPWHGADRIVPLLVELRRRGLEPRTIVIGGGPTTAALEAAADHVHLGDQLVVTGALPPDEASRRLRDAAIGLAPYPRQSPFYFCPLKVVDYLAAGLAVVSTRQGDIERLVGDAGVLLDDPDDDAQLADVVEQLLVDDARRIEMALSGRRRAMSSMTWQHVADTTVHAIDRLVGVASCE